MPRIKRWFPVNHNINRDPEVWVMRREIGEKSLSVWLEFLSIADQNEGELPGDYEALIRSVSGTCQATVRTVTAVYQYAISKLWLASEPTLHVVKYLNYHRSREPQKPFLGSLPSEPSEPDLTRPKRERDKTAQSDDFAALWILFPGKGSKKLALEQWDKLNPDHQLAEQILGAVRNQIVWRESPNGEFRPQWQDLHRWLRNRRWQDEIEQPKPNEPYLTPMDKLRLRREAMQKEAKQ